LSVSAPIRRLDYGGSLLKQRKRFVGVAGGHNQRSIATNYFLVLALGDSVKGLDQLTGDADIAHLEFPDECQVLDRLVEELFERHSL
jgi:hypothetical protein